MISAKGPSPGVRGSRCAPSAFLSSRGSIPRAFAETACIRDCHGFPGGSSPCVRGNL